MSTRIRRSMAAAVMMGTCALTGFGQVNSTQVEETTMLGDHQVPGRDKGRDYGFVRSTGAFGGAISAAALLSNLVNHASIEDSDTHDRKVCGTIGNCKVAISSDPSAPPFLPDEMME